MRGNKGLRNGMFALVIAVILGAFGWSPAAYGGQGTMGDINGDGTVNVTDVIALVIEVLQGSKYLYMDFNGDGVLDALDIMILVNIIMSDGVSVTDSDGDGVFDDQDMCEGFDDAHDPDCDGIPSGCDNCLSAYNPTQDDTDSDGNGDVCETTCYSFCCMALTDDCMACVDCWINGGLDVNEYCLTPVADGGGLGSGYCDVPLSYVDTSQCP